MVSPLEARRNRPACFPGETISSTAGRQKRLVYRHWQNRNPAFNYASALVDSSSTITRPPESSAHCWHPVRSWKAFPCVGMARASTTNLCRFMANIGRHPKTLRLPTHPSIAHRLSQR